MNIHKPCFYEITEGILCTHIIILVVSVTNTTGTLLYVSSNHSFPINHCRLLSSVNNTVLGSKQKTLLYSFCINSNLQVIS